MDLYEDLSRIEGLALRKEVDLEIRRWRWHKRRMQRFWRWKKRMRKFTVSGKEGCGDVTFGEEEECGDVTIGGKVGYREVSSDEEKGS